MHHPLLVPGTFMHNAAGVSVIVVCTKADLIDDNDDLVGAGASGMGGMAKGKGGEWRSHADTAHGLSQVYAYNAAADNTQCFAPVRAKHPLHTSRSSSRRRATSFRSHTNQTHSTVTSSSFLQDGTAENCGPTRRLRCESMNALSISCYVALGQLTTIADSPRTI